MKVVLRFDGGCRGNPGEMYGSYEVTILGLTPLKEIRFELGHGTCNVAEFRSLQRGLLKLVACVNPVECDLQVITDSMIVRNRLMGKNKLHKKPAWEPAWAERSAVMRGLVCECLSQLHKFKSFTVEWQGRASNVTAFGH